MDNKSNSNAAVGSGSTASSSSKSSGSETDDDYCILAFYQFILPTPLVGSSGDETDNDNKGTVILNQQQQQQQQNNRWRDRMNDTLRSCEARGSVLLAVEEGMNGTVCVPRRHEATVARFLQAQGSWLVSSSLLSKSELSKADSFHQQQPSGLLQMRKSYSPHSVFHRLQVRVKREIVTMGPVSSLLSGSGYLVRPTRTGTYVSPGPAWDALLDDPDCLVVDTRNAYEVELGTFRGAIHPNTTTFCQFPAWLHRRLIGGGGGADSSTMTNQANDAMSSSSSFWPTKVAMFCTGGIRCEKATAYCLALMEDAQASHHEKQQQQPRTSSGTPAPPPIIPAVYHLQGGILAYLDTVPESQSSFVGECFVFDQRVAVTHGLHPTQSYTLCHACRHPLPRTNNIQDSRYVLGTSCPNCYRSQNECSSSKGGDWTKEEEVEYSTTTTTTTEEEANVIVKRIQRYAERQRQMERAERLGTPHMHDAKQEQFLRRHSSATNNNNKQRV